jgi:uncharacterized membrane protein YkvA (DUF1232 family)
VTELETRCLDAFPGWIRSLADDAIALAQLLSSDSLPVEERRQIAAGLNYVFKSLDLIPDGLEDLGYLDDAFVLRTTARLVAAIPGAKDADMRGTLARLAGDSTLVSEFLANDDERLVRYVKDLVKGGARGRSVTEIVDDSSVRSAFLSEVHAWAKSYVAPGMNRDEKNLVKLKSFLSKKLPA